MAGTILDTFTRFLDGNVLNPPSNDRSSTNRTQKGPASRIIRVDDCFVLRHLNGNNASLADDEHISICFFLFLPPPKTSQENATAAEHKQDSSTN
mmetsp:Transcript_5950/g.9232  ORF Transcript_5950/g.9232 Transcript_5950/m.9232 type:complete len:95 (-) Transcript_5950:471-755(-)